MRDFFDLRDSEFGLVQPNYQQIKNGSRQYIYKLGISYAEIKTKFPIAVGYYESKGWTQARIMNLTSFTVAYNEAAMRNPYHRASIKIPGGHWAVSAWLMGTMGIIEGVGTGGAADSGAWGTHLSIEGVQWMDDPLQKNIFVSWNKFHNQSEWSHSTKIRQMSLGGEMKTQRDPAYQSSGILIQNPGETCVVEDVYCTGFNDFGVNIDGGGAPCTIHNSSYFYNHRAGIGLGSAAISAVRIFEPSGDLNPYMLETYVGSDGSPAGGTITLISPKIEGYGNPNVHYRPGRGQRLAKLTGYYRVHITGGQQWVHNAYIDSAIRCESENPQGGLYDNYVRWDGLHVVNSEHILHDVSNNKKFKSGGNWVSGIHDIIWVSQAGGHAVTTFLPNDAHNAVSINAELPHVVATFKGEMPFINADSNGARDGNWDQSTGAIVGAIPNPITGIVMTPASTQVNKGQTITLTATLQGTGTFDNTIQWNIITGGGTLNTTTGGSVIFTAADYAVDNDAFTQIRATSVASKNTMGTVDVVIKAVAATNVVTGISAISNKPTLDEGTTATLTATVTGTGTFNNGVTWSIVSGGGTLSSTTSNPVTYTAPQVGVDTNVVIKATSVGDPTKTADIPMIVRNVIVVPPVSITSVAVAPATGQVNEGSSIILTATVAGTGAFNQNVTWTVMSGGGTLSSSSSNPTTYVSPQVAADTAAVVRAVAVGDTTKFASSTITVKNVTTPATITSVMATANPTSIQSSQTSAISATVNGTGPFNNSVTWTIVSGGGTLASSTSNSTTYTAPVVTTPSSVTLKATANGDTTKSTTITITLSPVSTGSVELVRTGWIPSASHYNTAGGNEPASNAIDGNLNSYWTGGIGQAPGQWFQIDMLSQQTFNRIIVDTSNTTFTDYIRGCQVFVSNDGVNWGTTVASAVGAAGAQYVANSLTINFADQTARFIRIMLNASSTGNWWAIGNLRVFGGGTTPPPTGTVTSVSIVASPALLNSAQASTLTATVAGTGTFNNSVTWSIVSGGGTLSNTANNPVTYTAPTTTTDITPQIKATSVGDPTKTAIINLPVKGVAVPPPTTGGIDPAHVLIVVNTNDPNSATLANQYAAAWGIPAANKVSVNLGTNHVVDDATFAAERAKVLAASTSTHEHYALCFAFPSRVGPTGILNSMQSITSAIVYGRRNVTSLTTNTLLNYNGLKPFTDKGVRASWMVMKSAYIQRSAHGARPTGMMYAIGTKDQSPPARGSVRASQCTALDVRANFEYIDLRAIPDSIIGSGQNPYQTPQNWAFDKYGQLFAQYGSQGGWPQADPRGKLFTKQPMAAAFLAMNNYDKLEEMVRQPGWVGDCVTSFAGYMPDGAGQTPLTYMLDLGASTACGLVAEPSSNFVPQFTDLTKFVPMWMDLKRPNAVAFWGSTQAIDRMLVAGDGMCAPFI